MLRVDTGHYRDVFGRTVYDVRRAKYPLGARLVNGWEYVLPATGRVSQIYPTKDKAAQAARLAIATAN